MASTERFVSLDSDLPCGRSQSRRHHITGLANRWQTIQINSRATPVPYCPGNLKLNLIKSVLYRTSAQSSAGMSFSRLEERDLTLQIGDTLVHAGLGHRRGRRGRDRKSQAEPARRAYLPTDLTTPVISLSNAAALPAAGTSRGTSRTGERTVEHRNEIPPGSACSPPSAPCGAAGGDRSGRQGDVYATPAPVHQHTSTDFRRLPAGCCKIATRRGTGQKAARRSPGNVQILQICRPGLDPGPRVAPKGLSPWPLRQAQGRPLDPGSPLRSVRGGKGRTGQGSPLRSVRGGKGRTGQGESGEICPERGRRGGSKKPACDPFDRLRACPELAEGAGSWAPKSRANPRNCAKSSKFAAPDPDPGPRVAPKGLTPWLLVPGSPLRSVRGGKSRTGQGESGAAMALVFDGPVRNGGRVDFSG